MHPQSHATPVSSPAAGTPVAPATPETPAALVARHLPSGDVPFSGISGIKRVLENGRTQWQICISDAERTGIAHGTDFRTTMADAIKDLAQRRPALVR